MSNKENKLPVDCPACGQRFSVTVPQVEIVNTLTLSMIAATHERPVSCLCGQKFGLGMLPSGSVSWGVRPMSEEDAAALEPSRIVTPGLSLLTGRAVNR